MRVGSTLRLLFTRTYNGLLADVEQCFRVDVGKPDK